MNKSQRIYRRNIKMVQVSVLDTNWNLCYDFSIFENENAVMKRVHF